MATDNPLIVLAAPFESGIRLNYAVSIKEMTLPDGTRDEDKWGFFCDQDQLYYLAYRACNTNLVDLGQIHDHVAQDREHPKHVDYENDFTDYLNALFEIEAKLLGFDSSV